MENKKNRVGIYLLIAFASFCFGVAGMYGAFRLFPKEVAEGIVNINKTEKEVTVTDTGIADAVDKIMDAVVVVNTYSKGTHIASGTGFVYKAEAGKAYILTNHHVIESGDEIKVVFTDGTTRTTKVTGSDQYADIAVLSFSTDNDIVVAEIGKSEESRVGDTVFAVGAPLDSIYSWTVTRGIVSGKDRMVAVSVAKTSTSDWIMKVMQTDAAINAGNSGGPLANSNGQVIGINSLKLVSSGVEGMGFAIPIEEALNYAEQLVNDGKIFRPYLGVSTFDVSDAQAQYQTGVNFDSSLDKGVVISYVEPGSPAANAGLQIGDVVIELNDVEVGSMAEFRYELFKYNAGDKIELTFYRGSAKKTTNVTLKTAP